MKTLSKCHTKNWSYNLKKITEIVNDAIPSYKEDILPERYNEVDEKFEVVNKTK